MIIPAGSSRRASQPPFWRIFQLVRAVGPSSPCSTSPENTTKWVFQSKNPASRRASQPPFWRIFQLDRAVGPSSPCSTPSENTTKWVFQSKKEKKKTPKKSLWANAPDGTWCHQALGQPTTLAGPGLVARLYEHCI